jgi:hypothetical protein
MTWANLVRKWVGYENDTAVEITTNTDQEDIVDQWLMVELTENNATDCELINVTEEPLPSPELVKRRNLWKKRLEKASKTPYSPLPPRAKVLKKSNKPVRQIKKKTNTTTQSKRARNISEDNTQNSTSDEVIQSHTESCGVKKIPQPYRGYVGQCRPVSYVKTAHHQHNRCIQQPTKKN